MTDDAERTAELRPAEALPDDVQNADAGLPGAAVAGTSPDDGPAERRGRRSGRTLGRDLLASGALAVILTALGFPFAMLWQVITPRVEFVTVEGGWYAVDTYSDGYVRADLYFAGMGLALGILAAIVAWYAMRGRRGPIVLLGLVIGSIACQVVAWRIGRAEWEAFWDAARAAAPGMHMWRPPSVLFVSLDPGTAWDELKVGHVTAALDSFQLGALGVMALAAVFTYTVCAGWSRWPSLRPSLRARVPE
ncbi:DUF2567 domain-containing protein [Glycomyces arizonensis]|uniref:DUF2567 domain-containing protein n=1 Tax=Glycomyces arizonensis TaxID=256035 RepID=UPI000429E149|nr:DUF2567 domain-containing protein [Glycomyces arizonensis]